eukprot:9492725-Pyramimonas_sp.AAC.2
MGTVRTWVDLAADDFELPNLEKSLHLRACYSPAGGLPEGDELGQGRRREAELYRAGDGPDGARGPVPLLPAPIHGAHPC